MNKTLLYITNGINGAGGLERVLSIKASVLADHYNYEIHIVTLNQRETQLFYNFSKNITYHNILTGSNSIKYAYDYIRQIRAIIKHINPHIISVCDDGLKGFFVPLILGKPCPMIYERHVSKNIEIKEDSKALYKKFIYGLKYKMMLLGAIFYDKFIVLTNDNINEWDLKNIAVISNPLSFYPTETANLENKIVLAVGRQNYQKGYDRLLTSWREVVIKHPDWQLHIYGKFDPTLNLEQLAKELKIEESVKFFEPTKDIVKVYLEASIYVMSSRFEGFGMVLIEAMACGLPVISFDCPCGPRDIIENGVDGILVKNHEIELFSNAIIKLIEDESMRIKLGKNAKTSIKRYLPEYIVPQWDQLFKNLLS